MNDEQVRQAKGITVSRLYYIWSTLVISILVLASSSMGIFVNSVYSKDTLNWATQARGQDVADIIAIGVLVIGAYLMSKQSIRGLQIWAGGLLFLIYAFVIYAFASPFNSLFLLYVAILGLLVYTFLGGVLRLNFERIKEIAPVSRRIRLIVGTVLLVLALFFYFLWLSQDIPALLSGTVPASVTQTGLLTNPVHVLDMGLYLPALIITGISLWKDKVLGYVFALPLVVFSVLTVIGILLITVV